MSERSVGLRARCPLTPQSGACGQVSLVSAMGQKPTSAPTLPQPEVSAYLIGTFERVDGDVLVFTYRSIAASCGCTAASPRAIISSAR